MSEYAQLLGRMMQAVLEGDAAGGGALWRGREGFAPPQQMQVYIDGYRYRVVKILRAAFPCLRYTIGKERFDALASAFTASHPPHAISTERYALEFAGYALGHVHEAFAQDVLTLEAALCEVYSRPDGPALDAGWLAAQTPETLATAPVVLRPACCLLALDWPVSDYLEAFRQGQNPVCPEPQPEYLMIVRDHGHMRRIGIEPAEYTLLSLVTEGDTLGMALSRPAFSRYVSADMRERFREWFTRWVDAGALALAVPVK